MGVADGSVSAYEGVRIPDVINRREETQKRPGVQVLLCEHRGLFQVPSFLIVITTTMG